jgi:hypothetical protein
MLRLMRIPEGFLSTNESGQVVLSFSDACNGYEPKVLEEFFREMLGRRVLISIKMDEPQEAVALN